MQFISILQLIQFHCQLLNKQFWSLYLCHALLYFLSSFLELHIISIRKQQKPILFISLMEVISKIDGLNFFLKHWQKGYFLLFRFFSFFFSFWYFLIIDWLIFFFQFLAFIYFTCNLQKTYSSFHSCSPNRYFDIYIIFIHGK